MTGAASSPTGPGAADNPVAPDAPSADRLLADMLAVLPDDHLIARPPAIEVPATLCREDDWLREQIRLRGDIWGIDDEFVLGTLWWYSASTWLLMPAVTAWFVTGRALSPRLQDVRLFHRPDSRIPGSRSVAVGPADLDEFGAQLAEALSEVIDALAGVIGKGERRLWSFVVDAIAGRLLWAAQRCGRRHDVAAQAAELTHAISRALPGAALPQPRLIEAPDVHVRRGSCCLLYRVPGESKCRNCPRQTPAARLARLNAG